MPDHFAQLALTRYAAPDERLRLALADHALGRMTAAAWAELAQELVRDATPDEEDGLHFDCPKQYEVDDLETEKEELKTSLSAVFEWLRANPKASCADAVDRLSEHAPE